MKSRTYQQPQVNLNIVHSTEYQFYSQKVCLHANLSMYVYVSQANRNGTSWPADELT